MKKDHSSPKNVLTAPLPRLPLTLTCLCVSGVLLGMPSWTSHAGLAPAESPIASTAELPVCGRKGKMVSKCISTQEAAWTA